MDFEFLFDLTLLLILGAPCWLPDSTKNASSAKIIFHISHFETYKICSCRYVIISCSIQQLYKLFLFRYVSHRLPSFIQQSFHFHSWSFNINNILPLMPCHNMYHSTPSVFQYYLYPSHSSGHNTISYCRIDIRFWCEKSFDFLVLFANFAFDNLIQFGRSFPKLITSTNIQNNITTHEFP